MLRQLRHWPSRSGFYSRGPGGRVPWYEHSSFMLPDSLVGAVGGTLLERCGAGVCGRARILQPHWACSLMAYFPLIRSSVSCKALSANDDGKGDEEGGEKEEQGRN